MVTPPPAAAEVRLWLDWAGARLLAMRLRSPAPKPYGSSWPSFAPAAASGYGYTSPRLQAPLPSAAEISLMDAILALPALIPDEQVRRIVQKRLQVAPISGRYINTWPAIAKAEHLNRKAAARLYLKGLDTIAKGLTPEKTQAVRKSFDALAR